MEEEQASIALRYSRPAVVSFVLSMISLFACFLMLLRNFLVNRVGTSSDGEAIASACMFYFGALAVSTLATPFVFILGIAALLKIKKSDVQLQGVGLSFAGMLIIVLVDIVLYLLLSS